VPPCRLINSRSRVSSVDAPGVTRTTPRALVWLLDDSDVTHDGRFSHEQIKRSHEKPSDVFLAYFRARHIDAKPLGLKTTLIREGNFCIENSAIFGHLATVTQRPLAVVWAAVWRRKPP